MKTPPGIWRMVDLPETDYRNALDLQNRIVTARTGGTLPVDVVLILEHPPVFTLGRRGGRENLTVSESFLNDRGIEVVPTERGGNITFHGPGQLVAYPIVHLQAARITVVDFVDGLEEAMIRTAACFGVTAVREAINRGVWVDGQKLGSIGICVRHGVSFHGLALNVSLSLEPFDFIHPCGLAGVRMTSLTRETGREVSMPAVRKTLIREMETTFGIEAQPLDRDELNQMLQPARQPDASRLERPRGS